MNKEIFVQNIKKFCKQKGVKPTIACVESGAGRNIINQMESNGRIPSVEKVQALAAYLGVTTSELLGEEAIQKERPTPASFLSVEAQQVAAAFDVASEKDKSIVRAALGL